MNGLGYKAADVVDVEILGNIQQSCHHKTIMIMDKTVLPPPSPLLPPPGSPPSLPLPSRVVYAVDVSCVASGGQRYKQEEKLANHFIYKCNCT